MRRAGNRRPVPALMLLGGLAALPGCVAAPAVNMASQMLMQNQHPPAQPAPGDAAPAADAQTAAAQPAGTQPAPAAAASPLALLGQSLPSAATIASLAQHLGLPVGGLVPGMQTLAHAQTFLSNPNLAHPAPAQPGTDQDADPPATVAAATQ